jgi:glycosyltransferase involved in cell wall biosynthesis
MHVTIFYPGTKPVPPPLYGGGQRAMYWLGKALIQLGHRVTLIAHRDSHIPGAELRPLPDPECKDDSWTRLIPDSTDVLHLRRAPRGPLPKPYVFTMGGNGQPGQKFPRNTLFVSKSHARNHCSAHFVYNGVDPADYECATEREDYAVFLAKASWHVKNLPGAIEVCRRAGVDLHVIGSRNWPLNLHRYLPRIRGVHYHGMLGQDDKIALLQKARCLVFPVRWHEPCANAINEALASGCYIAATPYGCLPEIVAAQVGFLSNRVDDLAAVVADPGRFSPTTNRAHILEHFTHLHMARGYLDYYTRVITTGTLESAANGQPQTAPGFSANQLLDWFS